MKTLRIRHSISAKGEHLVAVDYDPGGGSTGLTTPVPFTFSLTERGRNRLRFYMEDFLKYPDEPARENAKALEDDMAAWGEEMFRQVFLSDRRAQRHYEEAVKELSSLRIEVQAEHPEAWSIPWEILRDPEIGYLAVQAQSFVRLNANPARGYGAPRRPEKTVRILYAICRPEKGADVPFRSTAGPLLSAFSRHRESVQIDVLRPPTFDELGKVLRAALEAKRPYQILHFDGHGVFTDQDPKSFEEEFDPRFLGKGGRAEARGYLVFEDPKREGNRRLVSGEELGELLVRAKTPLVVLDACQSAMARLAKDDDEEEEAPSTGETPDDHAQDRAYTSLAHEIMDHGAGGVVGMQWSVYVETAGRFVEGLYRRLVNGLPLGEAANAARADLRNNPRRDSCLGAVDMQDWPNPVVYEAATTPLFAKGRGKLKVTVAPEARRAVEGVPECVPRPPDWGFVGRDEVLLALDRSFDEHSIVLLHAFAGSGKTAAAREFAVWYWETGGLDIRRYDPNIEDDPAQPQRGGILWSSFESHNPIKPFDDFGEAFAPMLEQGGVPWSAITDRKERADVALQVLGQVPILWVWDNVEPVAGWPAGSKSEWSDEERKFLADFLRDVKGTRCKVLLTSRRDEKESLEDVPFRIEVPPMPMDQRVELAAALAARQQHSLKELADLRPLLRFSQGNPLTITVLVKEALRQGVRDGNQVQAFVDRLREGKAAFRDAEGEGRSASLGASLDYGFRSAFTEEEQKRLALLHLFEGFVAAAALVWMGDPKSDRCLDEIRDVSREEWSALLDRAAGAGLLTAYGGGYYAIHPALPWFFAERFEALWGGRREGATRAWLKAEAVLGTYCHVGYEGAQLGAVSLLRGEEGNLLRAKRLARELGMWVDVMGAMQGLRALYEHTGRRSLWKSLVEDIVADFVDGQTAGPVPGREEEWGLVMEYRIRLAMQDREWVAAETLLTKSVEWHRARARDALGKQDAARTEAEKLKIRNLCVALQDLGHLLSRRRDSRCLDTLKEAYELDGLIGDRAAQGFAAFNIGETYLKGPGLRDLDQAERWARTSLGSRAKGDRMGQAQCHAQLGDVFWERFSDAREAGESDAALAELLNGAASEYHEALELDPPDSAGQLAAHHFRLGAIYMEAGDFTRAVSQNSDAIRLFERAQDPYYASVARFSVAVARCEQGRFSEGRPYARAALKAFESFGPRATEEAEVARQLLAEIDEALGKGSGKGT